MTVPGAHFSNEFSFMNKILWSFCLLEFSFSQHDHNKYGEKHDSIAVYEKNWNVHCVWTVLWNVSLVLCFPALPHMELIRSVMGLNLNLASNAGVGNVLFILAARQTSLECTDLQSIDHLATFTNVVYLMRMSAWISSNIHKFYVWHNYSSMS